MEDADGGWRYVFPPGAQGAYLRAVRDKLELNNWIELGDLCGCHVVTVSRWVNEHTGLPPRVVGLLHRLSGIAPSAKAELVYIAGSAPLEITYPGRTPLLAYFCGVMLGDGCIYTNKATYVCKVVIANNALEEREFAAIQSKLFQRLFGVHGTIYEPTGRHALSVELNARDLCTYLTSAEVGLHAGSKVKQQVGIPHWILSGSKEIRLEALRGLMDTDGCVYQAFDKKAQRHYLQLSFNNSSWPLLDGVTQLLCGLGYHAYTYTVKGGRAKLQNGNLTVHRQAEIRRYMREVGTRNPYRLRQYLAGAAQARADGVHAFQGFREDEALLAR